MVILAPAERWPVAELRPSFRKRGCPTRTAFDAELRGHGVLCVGRRAPLVAEVFAAADRTLCGRSLVEPTVASVGLLTPEQSEEFH